MIPRAVPGVVDAVQVVSRGWSTCVRHGDGRVSCWGWNQHGQIGAGSSETRILAPVSVSGLDDAIDVSSGSYHACALRSTGTVSCWGSNEQGQLGDGTRTDSSIPVDVVGLEGVVDVEVDGSVSCVLKGDGQVVCWGYAWGGALGDGPGDGAMRRLLPGAPVRGIDDAVALSSDGVTGCALRVGGAVSCWGWGTIITDTTRTYSSVPLPFEGFAGATSITVGSGAVCARMPDGSAACWGSGGAGQLGDDTFDDRFEVAPVVGLTGISEISLGPDGHACALLGTGEVYCWGENGEGQIGDGNRDVRVLSPEPVRRFDGRPVSVACGEQFCCAPSDDGRMGCWGYHRWDMIGVSDTAGFAAVRYPRVHEHVTDAAAVATGAQHGCARFASGLVSCWGGNSYGQHGDGWSSASTPVPRTLAGLTASAGPALGASAYHVCVIEAVSGAVVCWGRNAAGQVGNGTTSFDSLPATVAGLEGARQVAVGGSHTCAVLDDGTVWCWGTNSNGQLGDGTSTARSTPVPSAYEEEAIAVAAGGVHTCALSIGGDVHCWGAGYRGALGDGTTMSRRLPVRVGGITGATEICAGDDYTCAVDEARVWWCWGAAVAPRIDGRLDDSLAPWRVDVGDVTSVACGRDHACAIRTDGSIWCWGEALHGAMGVGAFDANRPTPERVRNLP